MYAGVTQYPQLLVPLVSIGQSNQVKILHHCLHNYVLFDCLNCDMQMCRCQLGKVAKESHTRLCNLLKSDSVRYTAWRFDDGWSYGMYDYILTELDNQIFHIILNRPDKRNALHQAIMLEIDRALDEAEKAYNKGEARVLFLRAEGRAFSSGIDLVDMDGYVELFGEQWQQNLFATTRLLQNILTKIERSSLPSICLMHGYCLGMGLEMALACDFRMVAERTKIGLPESRLGLVPDVGGTVRLVKLIGPSRAKEVILTGSTIDLDKAEQWGMVNYVVPKDDLMTKACELAEELKLSAPLAVNYGKRVINDIADMQRGLNIEAWAQAALFRSEDFMSGVQAMITKTYPVEWKGK